MKKISFNNALINWGECVTLEIDTKEKWEKKINVRYNRRKITKNNKKIKEQEERHVEEDFYFFEKRDRGRYKMHV